MNNKEIVTAFYQEFFNDHNIQAADKYVREDYIQHNPGVPQGREGLKAAFEQKFKADPTFKLELKRLIQEDDMMSVYLKKIDGEGNTLARVVDIYRFQDGQLAEHWDVLMPVAK